MVKTDNHSTTQFEDAMFGGIEIIIKFYEPYIMMLVTRNEDRSRATLGANDLKSHCQITIWKCWQKQLATLNIKNFDMMVKQAMQNTIRTIIGKEYCIKRGRCSQVFFSELTGEFPDSGEEDPEDVENAIYQQETDAFRETRSTYSLFDTVNSCLELPRLQNTFAAVSEYCSLKNLNINPFALTRRVKNQLLKTLDTNEKQLEDDLFGISLILNGFRHTFCH